MSKESELDFPVGNPDERELLLSWLHFLRGAILRKLEGVSDEAAHWHPDGGLVSLLGIVNHLTHVESRWIDGSMQGAEVSRSEAEFRPGPELTVDVAVAQYQARAEKTDEVVRLLPSLSEPSNSGEGRDLRWVLLHLINETARHAGHADSTRELLDGVTGE
ncbi:MAG: DinB family protein [Candidatus Dormibacteria bacterium]